MKEIVINRCHGGFSLSKEAIYDVARRKGLTLYPEANKLTSMLTIYWTVPLDQRPKELIGDDQWFKASMEERKASNEAHARSVFYDRDLPRDDPDLIATIKALSDKANGRCADLAIVEIPDDVDWTIEEYDGLEWVAEAHRTWS